MLDNWCLKSNTNLMRRSRPPHWPIRISFRNTITWVNRFFRRLRSFVMRKLVAAKHSSISRRNFARRFNNDTTEANSNTEDITAYNVRIVKVTFSDDDCKTTEAAAAAEEGEEVDGENFPNAIWPVLALAQCFGLMPVTGIQNRNQTNIAFRWRTFRALFSIAYLVMAVVALLLFLKRIVSIGISARNIVGLVFYSCSFFSGLLFLFLAQNWSTVMEAWCRHEAIFLRPPYIIRKGEWKLSSKIRLTAAFFLGMALLEHFMYFASVIYTQYMRIQECNLKLDDVWQYFFVVEHRHVFKVVPYHVGFTLLVLYLNFAFTFAWNYMDIFIMLISIGLSTRFNQINRRISGFESREVTADMWHEVRCHYVLLCELLEVVDQNLAPIIMLSCTNNLYFICFQLLNIFNSLPYAVNYVYFWYSMLYLIGRTGCVFLCASGIHDAARKPLRVIRHTLTSNWNVELERFNEQITTEHIALSGMKFFYLTRKLLFGMAGTIVTYELVLLQIDAGTKKTGNIAFCDIHA